MDLSLPELNGLDATRQILKDTPDTEVLVLTMHQSEELARDVLQAGARGYVLKSDADENLMTAVDSLRQHKPFLTSTVTEFVLDGYVRRWRQRTGRPPADGPRGARSFNSSLKDRATKRLRRRSVSA